MTEQAALSGKRILVVEDEAIVAMLIEDILMDHGAAVVGPAARIETAMELADGEAIDAAVLDVNLAGATTAPVAERLRARGIPFAFATGYGVSGLPAGFEDSPLLQKPFQEHDLTAVLSRTLGG
jgi:CheY-like chemotaxis protein